MADIVIVDDERFIHKVLERVLRAGGHNVVGHAYNGTEAINVVSNLSTSPDLVLMDHRMPVMNGLEATRKLIESHQNISIIFVSADHTIEDEAIETGAERFLCKPIRSKELLRTISDVIDLKLEVSNR